MKAAPAVCWGMVRVVVAVGVPRSVAIHSSLGAELCHSSLCLVHALVYMCTGLVLKVAAVVEADMVLSQAGGCFLLLLNLVRLPPILAPCHHW